MSARLVILAVAIVALLLVAEAGSRVAPASVLDVVLLA